MPDYNAPSNLPFEFIQAAQPAAPQTTAILPIDPEVMDWFQQQGPNWQADMSSVLRGFMQDVLSMDRHAPQAPDDLEP